MTKPDAVYLTLLVYLRDGKESSFLEYENKMVPLLKKYGGRLEFRLKTMKNNAVVQEEPDEIHIVSFPSHDDYERYRQDPGREALSGLFTDSVARAQLFEGQLISKA